MAEVEDTEITLGTGKLLAMFFALVVICAVFFVFVLLVLGSPTFHSERK